MFLDPRDVLLDRSLRLLWIRGRGKAHHEQCLAARVDDEVLVRLGMDHDGLERILRFIGDGHRGADQDGEHRPEGIHVDAAGKAPPRYVPARETSIASCTPSFCSTSWRRDSRAVVSTMACAPGRQTWNGCGIKPFRLESQGENRQIPRSSSCIARASSTVAATLSTRAIACS